MNQTATNDTNEATNWEQIGYYLVIAVTGVATVFAGAVGAAVFVYFQFMGGV